MAPSDLEVVVSVFDVNWRPVISQTTVTVEAPPLSPASGPLSAQNEFKTKVGAATTLEVRVTNPNFWDFRGKFDVSNYPTFSQLAGSGLDPPTGVGLQQGGGLTFPNQLYVQITMGMLQDVTLDPSKVDQPPQSGANAIDLDIPAQPPPLVNPDPKASGVDRIRFLHHPRAGFTAPGKMYWAERKSSTPPRLIGIWRPDYYALTPGTHKKVGYILYFTPQIPAGGAGWGAYPFGHGEAIGGAQGYLHLGYRYLFWEVFSAHQLYQSRKKALIVVPIASLQGQYGDLKTRTAAYRLLREANFMVQKTDSVSHADWIEQDVGRVALAGFSAGVYQVQFVLDSPGDDAPLAEVFYNQIVREVYNLDGDPDASGFMISMQNWRRTDDDRFFRIYNQLKPGYSSPNILKQVAGDSVTVTAFPTHPSPATTTEVHFQSKRTLLDFDGGFFRNTDGFPTPTGKDPHHWISSFFMSHACTNSRF